MANPLGVVSVHTNRPAKVSAKEVCLKIYDRYCPVSEFTLLDSATTRCISDTTIEEYINVGQLASWPFTVLSHYATSEPFAVNDVPGMSGMRWSSTNAAYECIARVAPEHWCKFQHRTGCFSRMIQGAHLVRSQSAAIDKLVNRYGQNLEVGKYGMDGYMSRLAVRQSEEGTLRTTLKLREKEDCLQRFDQKIDVLVMLTAARMRADRYARKVLLSTGDKLLVELNRFAEADIKKGFPQKAIWGGYVSATNKRLYGCNLMGQILMKVRSMMRKEEAARSFDDECYTQRRGLLVGKSTQAKKRKRENCDV
jgi:predicted NAD-dependent protein-ADP-ribosyltransferase YbiA (DUF1768 family)